VIRAPDAASRFVVVQWYRGPVTKDGQPVTFPVARRGVTGVLWDFGEYTIDSFTTQAEYPGFRSGALQKNGDLITLFDQPGIHEGMVAGSRYEASVEFLVAVYDKRVVGPSPSVGFFTSHEQPRPLATEEWSFNAGPYTPPP